MEPSDAQIATLRPWIHPVRWLWRALRYFWATIFVSLLLGTLSGVFLLAKGTDLRTLIALNWLGQHLTLSLVAFLLFIAHTVCAVRRVVISLLQAGGIDEIFLGYQSTWMRKLKGTRAD